MCKYRSGFVVLAFLGHGVVHSAPVEFALSYAGSGFSTQAVLTAQPTATPNEFLITGMSGERNGVLIDNVLPANIYGENDNDLFLDQAVPFDVAGLAFTAGTTEFNVYADGGFLGSPVGIDECTSLVSAACLLQTDGSPVVSFSLRTVPEPNVLALFAIGLLAILGVMSPIQCRPSALLASRLNVLSYCRKSLA
jgi:hypothetical protein